MKPPIIFNESPRPDWSGDLSVYESVEWAERGLEPYAAADTWLRAYDSEGRLLKMTALWESYRVRLEPAEETPSHLEALTNLMRDYLPRIGLPPSDVGAMSLDEMLKAVYDRDPNPYSGYRPPGYVKPGFWAGLKAWFTVPKKR